MLTCRPGTKTRRKRSPALLRPPSSQEQQFSGLCLHRQKLGLQQQVGYALGTSGRKLYAFAPDVGW